MGKDTKLRQPYRRCLVADLYPGVAPSMPQCSNAPMLLPLVAAPCSRTTGKKGDDAQGCPTAETGSHKAPAAELPEALPAKDIETLLTPGFSRLSSDNVDAYFIYFNG